MDDPNIHAYGDHYQETREGILRDLSELLPCPFCGNAKNIAMVNEKHDHSGDYFIACPECGASTIMRYAMGDDPKPLLIEAWNRRAAVQAAQPEAVGWKLVPVEPTPAMLVAMWDHRESMRGQSENRIARAGYAAMLAAAPTPEPMSAPTAEPVALSDEDISEGCERHGITVWGPRAEDFQAGARWAELVINNPPATPPSAATEPSDADWADFGAWAERDKGAMDMLEKLIDVWDDGCLPYEHRCYVEGAWAELIAEARAAIRATKGGKL